jgi:hypothetical protein
MGAVMPQMTAFCQSACSSPEYNASLNAKGFSRTATVKVDGQLLSHDEIAATVDEAYRRLRPQYVVSEGARRHVVKKTQRQFERAVKGDVADTFHISWWTILFGALVLLFTGPLGLVFAIIACIFEYYLTKDLDGDTAFCMAMESGK